MESQNPDPQVKLEVDLMILDFLLNAALKLVLHDRRAQRKGYAMREASKMEQALGSVDAFLKVFRANHPGCAAPPDIHFRLRLLKFATLFCRRLTQNPSTPVPSTVSTLRAENRARAQRWKKANFPSFYAYSFELCGSLPLPADQLQCYRDHVLERLGSPQQMVDGGLFYGTDASVSLLDLLTPFMELSAARASLNADFSITWRWMKMAGEFMLQATLEQYLVRGAAGREVAEEAFAWGYTSSQSDPALTNVGEQWLNTDAEINNMFRAEADDEEMNVAETEIEGWRETRDEFCNMLQPDQFDLVEHLVNVAADRPIDAFEAQVVAFLEALSMSLPAPVLVQLENGQLDGLTRKETAAFKQKVGITW
ncbi:hypothetical protein MBLNU459_g7146t1 [Dothideomycetes sp. NU459]